MTTRALPAYALVAFACVCPAAIINVPAQQPTIQAGINAANNGDEVVVAPGTYTERIDTLGRAITVRSSGGAANTIIDGAGAGSVVTMQSGEGLGTILDGFTIRNGLAPFLGGGLFLDFGASPTIRHCSIESNHADQGGGLWTNGQPVIESCTFKDNTATSNGGAIVATGDGPGFLTVRIANCSFVHNGAENGDGGAIVLGATYGVVEGCAFSLNSAGSLGGAISALCLEATITGCQFSKNEAGAGGAVCFGASSKVDGAPAFASRGADGFFIPLELRFTLDSCVIEDNTTITAGGGLFIVSGGNGFFPTTVDAAVRNSLLARNYAANDDGGGMLFAEFPVTNATGLEIPFPSRLLVGACTFAQNESVAYGGGIRHFGDSPMRVVGCVLWGNVDHNSPSAEGSQFSSNSKADTVTRSCLQGLATLPGVGSTALSPKFVSELGPDGMPGSGDEDYHLGLGSACLDAGDANGIAPATPRDALGAPRVVDDASAANTGLPLAGLGWIDMGALERQGAAIPCIGDENEDGVVDFFDLNDVLSGYGRSCPPPR